MAREVERRLVAARLADRVGGDAAGELLVGVDRRGSRTCPQPLGAGRMAVDGRFGLLPVAPPQLLGAPHVVRDRDEDGEAVAERAVHARRGPAAVRGSSGSISSVVSPACAAKQATSAPNSPGCHSGCRAVHRHRPSVSFSMTAFNQLSGLDGYERTRHRGRRRSPAADLPRRADPRLRSRGLLPGVDLPAWSSGALGAPARGRRPRAAAHPSMRRSAARAPRWSRGSPRPRSSRPGRTASRATRPISAWR